jgi:hypothetical protein
MLSRSVRARHSERVKRLPTASAARWLSAGVAVAAASYAAYAGITWYRYGRVDAATGEDLDPLLDRFMPTYDIAERHHVRVAAPAEITLQAATEMDFQQSAVVRGIFKAREWIMRSHSTPHDTGAFLSQMRAMGWGVLAEVPRHEIVMGAVTQPWMADVVFRPLPAEEFAAFHEPNYVKIVWTLRADSLGATDSIFRTETRAVATDPTARAKFRRYWSLVSPGIIAIRWMLLGPLKVEAERRASRTSPGRES